MSLYTKLWNQLGVIATDVGILLKKMNTLALAAHTDGCTVARTGRDANGIFVTTTWTRTNGTVAKTSVLSLPDGSNRYTRRVDTLFDTDGTTALVTRTFTLAYNGFDQLITETLT